MSTKVTKAKQAKPTFVTRPAKKDEPTFVTPHDTNYDEQVALILKTHKNTCNHHDKTTKTHLPFVCDSLMRILSHAINSGHTIKNTTLVSVYNLITFQKSYYNRTNCLIHNKEEIIGFTSKLFAHQLPQLDLLKTLTKHRELDSCFAHVVTNKLFIDINHGYLDFLMFDLSKPSYGNRYSNLHKNLVDIMPITSDNLLILCNTRNFTLTQKLADIINKSEKAEIDKLFDNIDIVKIACENLPYTANTIIALLTKNYQITNYNFEQVCRHCVFKDIKYILELSRMEITSNHFKAIISTTDMDGDDYSGDFDSEGDNYIKTNTDTFENRTTKMELLFHNGFIPNKDDVKNTIFNHIEIPNISRFDLVLDDELLNLCRANNFYPKYNFSGIAPEMLELQEACNNKNFVLVKKLMKTHNLVPDYNCMEIVSKFKENKILDFMIQNGGKVNLNCVKKRAECYANNKFILTMINAYEKENTKEITQYKNRILELENFIKKNINDDVKMYNVTNLNVNDDNLKDFQLKYKNKKVPHKKIVEFFGIDKTQKINYIDFKNLLIEKINKGSWEFNNDDNLICIPLEYRTLFGLDDNINNVISIDDIDKLVCLFFMNI